VALVVGGIGEPCLREGPEVAEALGALAGFLGTADEGEEQAGEQDNDTEHDDELDDGKGGVPGMTQF
jgi:hypothetical protein